MDSWDLRLQNVSSSHELESSTTPGFIDAIPLGESRFCFVVLLLNPFTLGSNRHSIRNMKDTRDAHTYTDAHNQAQALTRSSTLSLMCGFVSVLFITTTLIDINIIPLVCLFLSLLFEGGGRYLFYWWRPSLGRLYFFW